MPTVKSSNVAAAAVLLFGLVAAAPTAAGYASAIANVNFGNLRFTFDDPNAFVTWEDRWLGVVVAYAEGADGVDGDADALLGDDGSIDAEAQSSDVYSLATHQVAGGQGVAVDPDASVAATTHSGLELDGKDKEAAGFANASLDNFFSIRSSQPLGTTAKVTILLDYAGQLTGIAAEGGFFDVFAGAFLELSDLDQDTGVITDLLDFAEFFHAALGSNTSYSGPFNGTLSITHDLFYERLYWLYAEADSDVYGAVPLPAALPLMLLGFGLLVCYRRR
jgi:hypothetical protein